jgi:hypothetical protein
VVKYLLKLVVLLIALKLLWAELQPTVDRLLQHH